MSFELKLTIKSQVELNELLKAIEVHSDISNDMSVEIISADNTVDKKKFNETLDELNAIARLKERLHCLCHLGEKLPKRLY